MTKLGRALLSRKPEILVISAFLVYSAAWSWIVLLRYFSYNADVFDLGLASDLLYHLSHVGTAYLLSNPSAIPFNKLVVLLFTLPYTFFPDPEWLIVFQTVWLGLGVFPLYVISLKYLKSQYVSVMISLSYLLYYPLAGVNWFDFHFMSVFPTAFLFSFMYYVQGRNVRAIIFGVLAIISDYLVPLIFLFLAAYILLGRWRDKRKIRFDSYTAVITAIPAAIIIGVTVAFGPGFTTQYFHLTGAAYSATYVAPTAEKIHYFIALQLPVLFLSLAGIEFLAVGIPFFALVFVNSYQPYVSTMFFQYPALISPVVFVAAVVGLRRLSFRKGRRRFRAMKVFAVAFLVLNVIAFSFFTPIGNMYTSGVYDSHYGYYFSGSQFQYSGMQDITVTEYDHYLAQISGHIPVGSSIMIQNNMPQLTAGYNWQLPDFMEKGFVPQYVVIDPYSYYFTHYSAAYHHLNTTMLDAANNYTASGNYSIEYSLGGVVLLNRSASQHISGFVPLRFNESLVSGVQYYYLLNNSNPAATFYSNSLPFIIPGQFEFTVSGSLNVSADNSSLSVYLVDQATGQVIDQFNFSANSLSFGGNITDFSGEISVILVSQNIPEIHSVGMSIEQISAGIL